ncbi:uncharacterized protein LOC125493596 [Beta vulgaris subsp. vulgaris]|uniref:uncharacterized protein LOC125493596 n=1 Tax=Beta vulgaris subsp. vulgaris TaxID=3555 RepID=UPI0020372D3B|nr:uncharacterized protein LOC125493596 [Beta vulgaris subsp. vulgaris]
MMIATQKTKKAKNVKNLDVNKEVSQGNHSKSNEVGSKANSNKAKSQPIPAIVGKISSKGSSPDATPKGTPLVSEQVIQSLSKSCLWLHARVSNLPDSSPIKVDLEKSQFHYLGEDSATWVYKVDIREFLCGAMLNISILQVFMSALYEDLLGCDSVSKVGWLCPQEIRDANCLHNHAEANEYIERSIRQCVRSRDKYIIAPYIEEYVLVSN